MVRRDGFRPPDTSAGLSLSPAAGALKRDGYTEVLRFETFAHPFPYARL